MCCFHWNWLTSSLFINLFWAIVVLVIGIMAVKMISQYIAHLSKQSEYNHDLKLKDFQLKKDIKDSIIKNNQKITEEQTHE